MIVAARFIPLVAVVSAGLTTFPAQAQTNAASVPDSLVEAIVYTTARPPNWDIYLFEEPGGSPRRLTDDPALDYNAVFSPDGRWLVFTSERNGNVDLYALDLDGNQEFIRLTDHPAMDDAASFSPDGRRLAFVSTRDGDADIFVMSFSPGDATTESRPVNLTKRPGGDFNPAFSPDGRRITYTRQASVLERETNEHWDIELCVMNDDGSGVQTLAPAHAGIPGDIDDEDADDVAGSPAWSPDGEAIYYYSFRFLREAGESAGDGEIRRVSLDGTTDVRVATGGYSPAVAPDGRIGFVRPRARSRDVLPNGHVVSMSVDGSDLRTESTSLEDCFAPDFDRSSRRMVCHGPGPVGGMVLVNVDDSVAGDEAPFAPPGAIHRVELPDRTPEVRGIRGIFPALTPDGDVLSTLRISPSVNTRAGRHEGMTVPLHISAIDGTGLRELFVPSSGIVWDPAVSRDAGWAVFAVGPTFGAVDMDVDIWRIRLDGSEPVNLTPDSPWNDALPAISDDGARIVFRSSRGVQPGPDDDRPRTAWPSAIYVMDGDGGNLRRLTDADTRETAPAISSNGEWVAYVVHENDVAKAKIWLRRVDGSEARLLEPERSHISDLSMHPASRRTGGG